MATYEKRNYWIAIIALIISVVSAILAYLAIGASWKIAELSGSFEKSQLAIGIGGFPLSQNGVTQVLLGAPVLSKDDVPVIGAIPYTIISHGAKTAEGVTLTVQYHKMFNRSALELMQSKISGGFPATEMKRSFTEGEDMTYVSYKLPSLDPETSFIISDPLYLSDTKIHDDVPVTFKDGTKAIIPVDLLFSLKFSIFVSARDISAVTLPLSVSIEKAPSIKAMEKGRLLEIINSEQKKIRKELSFLRYLGALLFSSPKAVIYLVYIPLDEVKINNIQVFGPKSNQEVAMVYYDLIKWSFLIHDES